MAFQSGNDHQPIHPQVLQSNPTPSAPPMPPSHDTSDLVSPETQHSSSSSDIPTSSRPPPAIEETLISIPGAILHLIDKHESIELACGDLSIIRLRQGENSLAVLARVANEVQWPLASDAAAVKLDESHYFFSLPLPSSSDSSDLLNYGLTFASKGQESRLEELDRILESYTGFSLHKVEEKLGAEVLDVSVEKGVAPEELMGEWAKKLMMEERSAAYWTTLAPNVEDYSGLAAKAIALGSGQLVRGILWCGEVTVDRMNKGNGMLKKRMGEGGKPAEISPEAMKRMERVKKVTKMSEKVATGILSGVVKVSGYFTSSVANSKAGKKFFGLLPGEIVLASLDGFGKICDAVEVAGKNVLSTSSVVTTGLVSHRYGDQAADFANHGLQSAGHAIGIAWTVFKVRKGFDPKNSITTSLAKSAAEAAAAGGIKGKKGK